MEPVKNPITVETTVHAPAERVWEFFTLPEHIVHWNNASPDWYTPRAENHPHDGGTFNFRMEARDGSMGFDFAGTYTKVKENEYLYYAIGDGRKVSVHLTADGTGTRLTEVFEAESVHPAELQRAGWQAILDNFKTYAESH